VTTLRRFDRICDGVGRTPIVQLGPSVQGLECQVYAKLEFLNPMGSIKDRIASFMVRRALVDGTLAPGGTIIESSSGNTGMGLAMMAILEGLRCRLVVRHQTSREKLDALRALGAELILVDGDLPPDHPDSYNQKARRLAAENPDAYFPDQHNNRLNNLTHYETTGPEIWEQMEGRIDLFVAGIGTGGTISGVARYLKERDPSIRVAAVDVEGSVFTEYFRSGHVETPSPYRLEGLGDEEIIECPELDLIDEMIQVSDREAFLATRELVRTEALMVGGSSGAALWGVRQLAHQLEPGARVVTVFPDSGMRYLTTIFSDDWMSDNGYL